MRFLASPVVLLCACVCLSACAPTAATPEPVGSPATGSADPGADSTGRRSTRSPAPAVVRRTRELARVLDILHGWDQRRAAAWAGGDAAALWRLYAPRSTAARADVALLRRYTDRGLVVRRLRTQVFAAQVVEADEDTVRLRVLERVAGGEVYDGRASRSLASSAPASRVVELVRDDGAWVVRSVSEWAGAPRSARPARPGR